MLLQQLTFNIFKNFKSILPILSYNCWKNSEYSLITNPQNLELLLKMLKNHVNFYFDILSCISGTDLLKKKYRFMVSYELLSLTFNVRLRIKIFVNEYFNIPSIISIYTNSNWWEREIWDMYGLFFSNHPDLRRILTDYGFEGNPLRKDFPLYGFIELNYDTGKCAIVSSPVVLAQEFRNFIYETPWQ
jgi:NADH/F420H2 dehydrogenase subunit C